MAFKFYAPPNMLYTIHFSQEYQMKCTGNVFVNAMKILKMRSVTNLIVLSDCLPAVRLLQIFHATKLIMSDL